MVSCVLPHVCGAHSRQMPSPMVPIKLYNLAGAFPSWGLSQLKKHALTETECR